MEQHTKESGVAGLLERIEQSDRGDITEDEVRADLEVIRLEVLERAVTTTDPAEFVELFRRARCIDRALDLLFGMGPLRRLDAAIVVPPMPAADMVIALAKAQDEANKTKVFSSEDMPGALFDLAMFRDANEDAEEVEDMMAELERLGVGGEIRFGVGGGPGPAIRRVR